MFVHSFKIGTKVPTKYFFDKYYIPLEEIEDLNELIDVKPFFDQLVKNKQKAYEKVIEMSRNNHYTGNILDISYYQNYYKLIGINLSRQTNTNIPQQKTILNSSLGSLIVTE